MNKLRRQIKANAIFLASLCAAVVICLPRVSWDNPVSYIAPGLAILNVIVVYSLIIAWFNKRQAGLASLILVSMPVWILMQLTIPRFTYILTPLLIAFWAFDRAGRGKTAPLWYFLSGIATTVAWLQEPLGVSLCIAMATLLLIIAKPRYIKHIIRQSSLILVILITTIAGISAASLKFDFGVQQYLVSHLNAQAIVVWPPKIYWLGVSDAHIALVNSGLLPLAILALAGLGAWQLLHHIKRPRNFFLLLMTLLFGVVTIFFNGMTALLLMSLTMFGLSTWAMTGLDYLWTSWQQVFPHNKLARSLGKFMMVGVSASLVLYSFWYINRAWSANPQAVEAAQVEWKGQL